MILVETMAHTTEHTLEACRGLYKSIYHKGFFALTLDILGFILLSIDFFGKKPKLL